MARGISPSAWWSPSRWPSTPTRLPLGSANGKPCFLGARKLVDASPVLGVDAEMLVQMRRDSFRLAACLELTNVMTFEYIATEDEYFFMEVNPRLTGGWRMSTAQTGKDLIVLQLAIHMGYRLSPLEVPIDRRTHCLEARIYLRPDVRAADDQLVVLDGFRLAPSPGVTYACAVQPTLGLRFEELVAQVLVVGDSREDTVMHLRRAMETSTIPPAQTVSGEIRGWLREAQGAGAGPGCDISA